MSFTQVQTRFDARFVPPYARDWRELEPVKRWRERVSPNTFPTYFGYLYRFLHSIGKDPSTAILWARKSPDKYDVLDAIQDFVMKLEGRRYKNKEAAYRRGRVHF